MWARVRRETTRAHQFETYLSESVITHNLWSIHNCITFCSTHFYNADCCSIGQAWVWPGFYYHYAALITICWMPARLPAQHSIDSILLLFFIFFSLSLFSSSSLDFHGREAWFAICARLGCHAMITDASHFSPFFFFYRWHRFTIAELCMYQYGWKRYTHRSAKQQLDVVMPVVLLTCIEVVCKRLLSISILNKLSLFAREEERGKKLKIHLNLH